VIKSEVASGTAPMNPAGWVVEILGDGTGARHRRYLVSETSREEAVKIVRHKLGHDLTITSTSAVAAQAFGVANLKPGEIVAI
jgi:hypothetical protein